MEDQHSFHLGKGDETEGIREGSSRPLEDPFDRVVTESRVNMERKRSVSGGTDSTGFLNGGKRRYSGSYDNCDDLDASSMV